jgi:hypothetical protein
MSLYTVFMEKTRVDNWKAVSAACVGSGFLTFELFDSTLGFGLATKLVTTACLVLVAWTIYDRYRKWVLLAIYDALIAVYQWPATDRWHVKTETDWQWTAIIEIALLCTSCVVICRSKPSGPSYFN